MYNYFGLKVIHIYLLMKWQIYMQKKMIEGDMINSKTNAEDILIITKNILQNGMNTKKITLKIIQVSMDL